MNKTLFTMMVIVGALASGCHGWGTSSSKPTVTTGFAANREGEMRAVVDDLKAQGYSEERARRIAAKKVPAQETTYTESLSSVLTGRVAKEKTERDEFEKDFAKSADGK